MHSDNSDIESDSKSLKVDMKSIKIKLTKNHMAIKSIVVTNDDGSIQTFVDEATVVAPVAPETIAIPLNTPIEIVAK
jgi:hypothetical protein